MRWQSNGSLHRILRWIWIYFLYWSGLIRWARWRIESSSGIVTLTFHRVLEDQDVSRSDSPPGMIVRRSTFENLLRFLTSHCKVVSLGEAPSWGRSNGRIRVAITFDDAWKDTSDIAFPLTQKWQVPITIFVCPGHVGRLTPFWPEHVVRVWRVARQNPEVMKALESALLGAGLDAPREDWTESGQLEALLSQLKRLATPELVSIVQKLVELRQKDRSTAENDGVDATMTWEDMAQIARRGAQLGSHTQSHRILTTIPATASQFELAESKRSLEARLGRPCTLFAYPNGSWSPEVRALVANEGYRLAFVNSPGVWHSETDPWLIPRVNLWEGSLTNASGKFSSIVFQYTTFWRAYRADSKKRRTPNC